MSYEAYNKAKAERAAVFQDTVAFYTEDPALAAAVKESAEKTAFYGEDDYPDISALPKKSGLVTVSTEGSFAAARRLSRQYPGKKICVLNFASATQPGGGVLSGSSAQEESLCRCSTLYPCLNQPKTEDLYYGPNRAAKNNLHTDACLYSPGIIVCKTDTKWPERLDSFDWITVDVISCAAPNLQEKVNRRYSGDTGDAASISPEALYELHLKRARHICTVAAASGAEVLLLGAFGCGAFCNDPQVVAKAFTEVLRDFRYKFEQVEFPILGDEQGDNYLAFSKALQDLGPSDKYRDMLDGEDEEKTLAEVFDECSAWFSRRSIDDLNLSIRSYNCLGRYMDPPMAAPTGCHWTVDELLELKLGELKSIRNLNRACCLEILEKLDALIRGFRK